jgi:hypothetical protein
MAGTPVNPVPVPGVGSDVSWLRYRRLAAFLVRLRRKVTCTLDVRPQAQGQPSLAIDADERSARALDRALGGLARGRFWRGLFAGTLLGLFVAYVIIPFLGTYVYSSRQGLLPPRSDALIRIKDINDQAMQILEHECEAHAKGMFGSKRVYFEADVDDSTTIRLTYDTSRKGVAMAVGQRVGARMVGDMVAQTVEGTGVDSLVGGDAESGVSRTVGSAVSRTASMQVEKSYRRGGVITVRTRADGQDIEMVNYLDAQAGHRRAFLAADADTADVKAFDHVCVRRDCRVPTPEDERLYAAVVGEFARAFFRGDIKGQRKK